MKNETISNMVPPSALEAESAVIGCIMTNPDVLGDVQAEITKQSFYSNLNAIVYGSIIELDSQNKPFDLVSVYEHLSQSGLCEDIGGMKTVSDMAKNASLKTSVISHAKVIHQKYLLRTLIDHCSNVVEIAYQPEGKTADQILSFADSGIASVMENTTSLGAKHIADFLPEAIETLDKRFNSKSGLIGQPVGIKSLDNAMGGLEDGELYVIAARPSMGKTAFALNLSQGIGVNGAKSLFISMEMPISQLIDRMWASFGVELGSIRNGRLSSDDWPRITQATSVLKESGIFVDETPALSVNKIGAIAKKLFKREGKMPIFLDYLQIMGSDDKGGSRYENVTNFSMGMKSLAKSLNTPVVILSQLSRNLEQRPDKRPIMSDLRESGAIEQDAGTIMFLYRDEVYEKDKSRFKGEAEAIIAKSRNGQPTTIPLNWEGHHQRFTDMTDTERSMFFAKINNNFEQATKRSGLS